jgi:hypothetical protein
MSEMCCFKVAADNAIIGNADGLLSHMDFPGRAAEVKSAGAAATFKNCEISSIVHHGAQIVLGDGVSGDAGVQLQNTTLTSSTSSFKLEAYNASEVYTDLPVYVFRMSSSEPGAFEQPLGLADAANSSLQFISLSDAQSLISVRSLCSATLGKALLPFTYLCCNSAQPSVWCVTLYFRPAHLTCTACFSWAVKHEVFS